MFLFFVNLRDFWSIVTVIFHPTCGASWDAGFLNSSYAGFVYIPDNSCFKVVSIQNLLKIVKKLGHSMLIEDTHSSQTS